MKSFFLVVLGCNQIEKPRFSISYCCNRIERSLDGCGCVCLCSIPALFNYSYRRRESKAFVWPMLMSEKFCGKHASLETISTCDLCFLNCVKRCSPFWFVASYDCRLAGFKYDPLSKELPIVGGDRNMFSLDKHLGAHR